jgi:hypothetical protein
MSKETEKQIKIVCDNIADMLVAKNIKYGDSALSPAHIFSKAPANEQILVRLDDKMSRIINSDTLRKNDTSDVIGYLVLLCINNEWTDFKDQID